MFRRGQSSFMLVRWEKHSWRNNYLQPIGPWGSDVHTKVYANSKFQLTMSRNIHSNFKYLRFDYTTHNVWLVEGTPSFDWFKYSEAEALQPRWKQSFILK